MAPKDTRISMIVDTQRIDVRNVEKMVEFQDNRENKKPTKDPKNFVSKINTGKKVFWKGDPKEISNDTIEIIDIQRKEDGGPELLQTKGPDRGHPGVYMATVKEDYLEGFESYSVKFRIKGRKEEFEVDPKLQMELKSHIE